MKQKTSHSGQWGTMLMSSPLNEVLRYKFVFILLKKLAWFVFHISVITGLIQLEYYSNSSLSIWSYSREYTKMWKLWDNTLFELVNSVSNKKKNGVQHLSIFCKDIWSFTFKSTTWTQPIPFSCQHCPPLYSSYRSIFLFSFRARAGSDWSAWTWLLP